MSALDIEKIREEYNRNLRYYQQIIHEASYVLDEVIKQRSIKIHNISGRVKDVDSLIRKASEKEFLEPLRDTKDISGIRVVCLFREDLSLIERIIKKEFNVISEDDKISNSDGFGYMSIHYICSIKDEYKGPRYDNIKDFVFEIQTRTLCMDAWAALSHYLAYKGEWDVPVELRKAMNALSGLFYVADNEFQQVYQAKLASTKRAQAEIENNDLNEIPINLDTINAYMEAKFPNRRINPDDDISKYVYQIQNAGYKTIEEIDRDVSDVLEIFEEHEKRSPPTSPDGKFAAIGALRVALSIASPNLEKLRAGKAAPYRSASMKRAHEDFNKKRKNK